MMAPKVVAFGGGHGLSASLAALRRVTPNLTAVVTVGDDGGSSGMIRDELGVLPPGDLRMALAALAGEDEQSQLWARLAQHRLGGDATLAGHPVGNLMLAGLADLLDDPVASIDAVSRLLGVVGRVLPLSLHADRDRRATSWAWIRSTRTRDRRGPRSGRGCDDAGPGRRGAARPAVGRCLPGGDRGGPRCRLVGVRSGVVVHQRDPASARAGDAQGGRWRRGRDAS